MVPRVLLPITESPGGYVYVGIREDIYGKIYFYERDGLHRDAELAQLLFDEDENTAELATLFFLNGIFSEFVGRLFEEGEESIETARLLKLVFNLGTWWTVLNSILPL